MATYLAAALPSLDHACGLGTIRLFQGDVSASPLLPVDGYLRPRRGEVDVEVEEPDTDLCPRWSQRLALTVAALVE
ncbi:O-succinylbenzoate synthase [Cutibacterium acnes JCM 18909]|nr:O-succinylbenzoate synthase [Cutibacterium acnes JCM 18909]